MPEFRPTSEASYVAPWRLPRQDFHLLANNSFSGRAVWCPPILSPDSAYRSIGSLIFDPYPLPSVHQPTLPLLAAAGANGLNFIRAADLLPEEGKTSKSRLGVSTG